LKKRAFGLFFFACRATIFQSAPAATQGFITGILQADEMRWGSDILWR